LGVGCSIRKLTVDKLAWALKTITTDTKMRERARLLGAKVRAENGVETAIHFIHRDLEFAKSRIQKLAQYADAGGWFVNTTTSFTSSLSGGGALHTSTATPTRPQSPAPASHNSSVLGAAAVGKTTSTIFGGIGSPSLKPLRSRASEDIDDDGLEVLPSSNRPSSASLSSPREEEEVEERQMVNDKLSSNAHATAANPVWSFGLKWMAGAFGGAGKSGLATAALNSPAAQAAQSQGASDASDEKTTIMMMPSSSAETLKS
jgi:hypothetical protein